MQPQFQFNITPIVGSVETENGSIKFFSLLVTRSPYYDYVISSDGQVPGHVLIINQLTLGTILLELAMRGIPV